MSGQTVKIATRHGDPLCARSLLEPSDAANLFKLPHFVTRLELPAELRFGGSTVGYLPNHTHERHLCLG